MAKGSSDAVFVLVKSLKKSEKRYFRLQNKSEGETKYLAIFEVLDNQKVYDEQEVLQKVSVIKPAQLSNLKAHLYKKLLQGIRQYNQSTTLEIQIREMIDYVQLLFNRGLYAQSVDVLKKAKKKAKKVDNLELQLEILKWEKNVLGHTIGPDNEQRVNKIIADVQEVNIRINNINKFTNLAAKLNAIYTRIGFIRSRRDMDFINSIFVKELPEIDEDKLSINEKMHLYNLYVGYYFFLQDFPSGYHYAREWVRLFDLNRNLKSSYVEGYISAINSLLIAQYKLHLYRKFVITTRRLREIRHDLKGNMNENIKLRLLKYTYVHEFNRIFMLGEFQNGVKLINRIKPRLEIFMLQLDNHSRIILYYKVACLYFGNDNYNEAVVWLNKIINGENNDLREDIHSFARILNLICHYELGNRDVIDYYIRSAYRYMLKKDDLYAYQKAILSFLRKLAGEFKEDDLVPEFKKLLIKLLPLQENAYEKRAFIYFDIISWLESKIQSRRVQDVIASKAPMH